MMIIVECDDAMIVNAHVMRRAAVESDQLCGIDPIKIANAIKARPVREANTNNCVASAATRQPQRTLRVCNAIYSNLYAWQVCLL
jgi:hypothetical protein